MRNFWPHRPHKSTRKANKKFVLRKHILRKQKGMALLMAIVLVPLILIVALSFVDPAIRSFRAATADNKNLMTKNIAENMFEEAMWESRAAGVGETIEQCICENGPPCSEPACEAGVDYGYGVARGTYWVFGSPEVDEDHLIDTPGGDVYTVPTPGSGDAGGDYCDTAEPIINAGMLDLKMLNELGLDPDILQNDVLEWPCHWNKLHEGESVTIPLYVEEPNGDVRNPQTGVATDGTVYPGKGLGLDAFELRIRTACDRGLIELGGREDEYTDEICAPTDRFTLLGGDDPMDPMLTPIVLWEITGNEDNDDGDDIYLAPFRDSFNPWMINSNFNVLRISSYNQSPQNNLTQDSKAFKDGAQIFISSEFASIHKPTLRLIAIHTLRKDEPAPQTIVPYLEYQFSADFESNDLPISSTSKVIRVEVNVEPGYVYSIERTQMLPKQVSGFVIKQ